MKAANYRIKNLFSVLFLIGCYLSFKIQAQDLEEESLAQNYSAEGPDSQNFEILEDLSHRFEDLEVKQPSKEYEQQIMEWESRSPFLINEQTIEDFEASLSIQSKLDFNNMDDDSPMRMLYNTTDQSNVCKRCIDNLDIKNKKRKKDQSVVTNSPS